MSKAEYKRKRRLERIAAHPPVLCEHGLGSCYETATNITRDFHEVPNLVGPSPTKIVEGAEYIRCDEHAHTQTGYSLLPPVPRSPY